MDILIWITLAIGGVVLTVAVNMFSNDLYDRCPKLAQWIIRRAVKRLPATQRDRYEEEWLSHAAECPGNMAKIVHAVQCWFAVGALAQVQTIRDFRIELVVQGSDPITLDAPTYLFFLKSLERFHSLPPAMAKLKDQLEEDVGGLLPDPSTLRAMSEAFLHMVENMRDRDSGRVSDNG